MDKKTWLKDNGFSINEITYCVIGNTYANREYLKVQGCKYSPLLKWHIERPIKVPDNCSIVEVSFNNIYEWNNEYQKCYQKQDAETWLNAKLNPRPPHIFIFRYYWSKNL